MTAKGQAVFFDGILFLLVVIFSVSLVFIGLNAYTTSQDRAINSAYFMNYMQSVSKSLYYIDARTMARDPDALQSSLGGGKPVQNYCDDLGTDEYGRASTYYCDEGDDGGDYELDCSKLDVYQPLITVMDLLKKDVSDPKTDADSGGPPASSKLDDKFGGSTQRGKTALRCAMKEVMKPFTFSGYHYLAEVTWTHDESGTAMETPIYPTHEGNLDRKFASDVMYTKFFEKLAEPDYPNDADQFDCSKTSSRQLVAVRTPFMILVGKGGGGSLRETGSAGGFDQVPLAFRVCVWPSNETITGS